MTEPSRVCVDGWVDVHAHFALPRTRAELEAGLRTMHAGCFLLPAPFQWTERGALAHMDRCGIGVQLLSNIPFSLEALKASNDYGAQLVARHPHRFGLLAALPTNDCEAALAEVARCDALKADGFAVTCCYNGVYLGDPRLRPVWAELDRRGASVFMHPDAYAPPSLGRPSPLLEVAFETARTVVDMLYAAIFRDFPNIRFVVAHCGGALPALAGRLALLGAEAWVPNPNGITKDEIRQQLRNLFYDTAATGSPPSLRATLSITSCDHLVYGSDCGVPCSTDQTLEENLQSLLAFPDLSRSEIDAIGHNALNVFPRLAQRLAALRAAPPPLPTITDGAARTASGDARHANRHD